MLESGGIPSKEPLIRVGIVLPEDQQKELSLKFNQPTEGIRISDGNNDLQASSDKLTFRVENGRISVHGLHKAVATEFISLDLLNEKAAAVVEPVIAGRGFHWAKHIPVKLPARIEISLVDDVLVLVNELPLELYLACVATSEMGTACPPAFLEAQTIVARAWMLANVERKHVSLGFDVCNDDCCQRYQGMNNISEQSLKAAGSSRGLVLIHDHKICDARYSKCCGGMMETFENLWEDTPLPYMQNISDSPEAIIRDLYDEDQAREWILSSPPCYCSPQFIPEKELKKYLGHVDESGEYYRWTIEITQEELAKNLREKMDPELQKVLELIPQKRAGSGRLLELRINYLNKQNEKCSRVILKDYEVRRLLHPMFLYSSAVVIETTQLEGSSTPVKFIYRGAGWGHGAGLCQIGGLGMGLDGKNARDIVLHYYPGAEVKKIYE